MPRANRIVSDPNEASRSLESRETSSGPRGRDRRSRKRRRDAARKKGAKNDAVERNGRSTSTGTETCEKDGEGSRSVETRGMVSKSVKEECDEAMRRPFHRWWSKLRGSDPITLDPLRKLSTAPFKLKAGEGSRVFHYFDAEVLARYLVSSEQFCHPITRRTLSRTECCALDDHLKQSGSEKSAIVTGKFDQVLEQKENADEVVESQAVDSREDESRRNREEEARDLLERLYVEGPTRQTLTRRVVRESELENRHVRQALLEDNPEEYPELPTRRAEESSWPSLLQSTWLAESSSPALPSAQWPALREERRPANPDSAGPSANPADLVGRVELSHNRSSCQRHCSMYATAVTEAQGAYSSRSLQTALSDPSRAYALEAEVESFLFSGKKRCMLAPADARWREVGHVLCESRGLTSCSLGNGSARRIHIFRGAQVNQSYQTLEDAMHRALEAACASSRNVVAASDAGSMPAEQRSLADTTMQHRNSGDFPCFDSDASSSGSFQQFNGDQLSAISNKDVLSVPSAASSDMRVASDLWDSEATPITDPEQRNLAPFAHTSWEEMAEACPGVTSLPPLSTDENKWQALEHEASV
eukprot:CAMPEP_0183831054 /NCGR_PEP_ID=MMETSP0807_2-20130328/4391_1 /TAXON_ID=88271 /ORGANISM="Picocystis salinarum, Strain CCMP1897" /LENGTH=589 /DNA_ID=CAMNT_0026076463 /DNA_START=13 /DNA_END=1782 /DNA_ORIENTATION=+